MRSSTRVSSEEPSATSARPGSHHSSVVSWTIISAKPRSMAATYSARGPAGPCPDRPTESRRRHPPRRRSTPARTRAREACAMAAWKADGPHALAADVEGDAHQLVGRPAGGKQQGGGVARLDAELAGQRIGRAGRLDRQPDDQVEVARARRWRRGSCRARRGCRGRRSSRRDRSRPRRSRARLLTGCMKASRASGACARTSSISAIEATSKAAMPLARERRG